MKAIVCPKYGVLELQEIDRPVSADDRVLVRVHAASVNPVDIYMTKGGLMIQLTGNGFRRPKRNVPGSDISGTVESVGANVSEFQTGDEVFGTCAGSYAEYAVGGKNLVPKPANITFEQAAGVGVAGLTALQGLRDKAQIQPGQTVLINGASGGVGTFAVQIAKAFQGEVTGVCSTRNLEMVQSIGADHVIDYTKEDFAQSGKQYDIVFDLVGNRSMSDLRRALKPKGVLLVSGGGHERGHGARGFAPIFLMAKAIMLKPFVGQKLIPYIAKINRADLATIKELMEGGKVTPVVDRTYPLSETPEAMRYLLAAHAQGKVIITV